MQGWQRTDPGLVLCKAGLYQTYCLNIQCWALGIKALPLEVTTNSSMTSICVGMLHARMYASKAGNSNKISELRRTFLASSLNEDLAFASLEPSSSSLLLLLACLSWIYRWMSVLNYWVVICIPPKLATWKSSILLWRQHRIKILESYHPCTSKKKAWKWKSDSVKPQAFLTQLHPSWHLMKLRRVDL